MQGAKQVQMLWSPITFFCHCPRHFVGLYLFHFLLYHFETWQCCFHMYKECFCNFSTDENKYVIIFLIPCWHQYCLLSAHSSGFTGGTTCPVILSLCELWLACAQMSCVTGFRQVDPNLESHVISERAWNLLLCHSLVIDGAIRHLMIKNNYSKLLKTLHRAIIICIYF